MGSAQPIMNNIIQEPIISDTVQESMMNDPNQKKYVKDEKSNEENPDKEESISLFVVSKKTISALSCPISLEIMEDPVVTRYGDTFDKKHLLNWLNKNELCPLSRRPININELIPNKNLKDCIERYRKLNLLPEKKEVNEENKKNEESNKIKENVILNFNINNQESSYYSGVLEPLDLPLYPNFTFIESDHYRRMVQTAYYTISNLNEWDFIRRYKPSESRGYLFDNDPRIQNILTQIDNNYGGHSGTSLALSIRSIQKIASIGFSEFERTFNLA